LDPHGDHSLSRSEKVINRIILFSPMRTFRENDLMIFTIQKELLNSKLICNEGSSTNPSINADQ